MQIPTKTLANGFSLPVYGLGLWEMGGRTEADTTHDVENIIAIHRAIDNGVTHIDTAELYGNGHAEELLGKVLVDTERENLIIASKVSSHNQTYDGVLAAAERSLQRLQTDYMDLYMLHRYPEPGMPIEDTMRAMDRLVSEGLVKHIGVCNMTPHRFRAAQAHTANKLVCNQVHFNLQYREADKSGVLKYSQANDILVSAWRPLQQGMLAAPELLQEMSARYGRTPNQIALNWLISQSAVVTLVKTSSEAHLMENLGSFDFQLSDEDMGRLTRDYPNQQDVSDAVPLNYEADIIAEPRRLMQQTIVS